MLGCVAAFDAAGAISNSAATRMGAMRKYSRNIAVLVNERKGRKREYDRIGASTSNYRCDCVSLVLFVHHALDHFHDDA
jgi:hypothetical protein